MRSRRKWPWKAAGTAIATALVCTAGLATAGPGAKRSAVAAPVDATAAITSCKGERLVLAFSLRASGRRSRAAKRAVRRLRGARLEVKLEAVGLFSGSPATPWIDLGRRLKASRGQAFEGLPAGVWAGVVDYRWLKGKKVVGSGSMRTERARVRGKRGKELCTLAVGRVPRDTTPPTVALSPSDGAWRRAPVRASIDARDDLSGVARVFQRVDGGPAGFGRSLTLSEEGAHQVEYAAKDVAGNWSALSRGTVRVDAAPPSKPVLDRPAATGPARPEVRWTRASDSASGVRSYLVLVRNSSNQLVASRTVAPTGAAKQSVTFSDPLPAGSYTAQVLAIDGTAPEPFTSSSDQRAFAVTVPKVVSSDPANGALRSHAQRSSNLTVNFDRPMENVNSTTVALERTGAVVPAPVTCNSPCTTATLNPTTDLPGGRYELKVSGASADGSSVTPYSADFRQVAYEEQFESACTSSVGGDAGNPWACADTRSDSVFPGRELQTASPKRCPAALGDRTWTATTGAGSYAGAAGEQIQLEFARLFQRANPESGDAAKVEALVDASPVASQTYTADTAAAAQTIVFANPSAATHQVSVRVTLTLAQTPTFSLACDIDASPGFVVDDVEIRPAP